jgi:hypothetical protein
VTVGSAKYDTSVVLKNTLNTHQTNISDSNSRMTSLKVENLDVVVYSNDATIRLPVVPSDCRWIPLGHSTIELVTPTSAVASRMSACRCRTVLDQKVELIC